jgi:hypothetical protein
MCKHSAFGLLANVGVQLLINIFTGQPTKQLWSAS